MLIAQVRSQTAYRASFVIALVGAAAFTALDMVTVIVLFHVTSTLGGFAFRPAFLMASIAGLGFALADLMCGNVERLSDLIRRGQLDALLVRPLGPLRQVLVSEFQPRQAGRVVETAIALVIAARLAGEPHSLSGVLLLVVAPLAGAVFFGSVFVISATIAFWWIDSGEFANGFTYGGRDFTTYPMTVYGSIFRRAFAFGLGFAFVSYYPTLAILGQRDPLGLPRWAGWISPLVALAAAGIAALVWRTGVRHYRSTGS